jgi:hypothetical protein
VVTQGNPHVERYLRQENDVWQFSDVKGLDTVIELSSIDCTLTLAEVYEQVPFADENEG